MRHSRSAVPLFGETLSSVPMITGLKLVKNAETDVIKLRRMKRPSIEGNGGQAFDFMQPRMFIPILNDCANSEKTWNVLITPHSLFTDGEGNRAGITGSSLRSYEMQRNSRGRDLVISA